MFIKQTNTGRNEAASGLDREYNVEFVAMDTDVGGGFPVASHLRVMSSEEKAVMDSGWTVITGGFFTEEKEKEQVRYFR